ncbi:hypothetical protein [Neobacillus jeddahensis]|uniref:hypothetical protein n=1 Tax=Neobacillus jeddahensis TaxID=1461580 RepID=UPI00058F41B0|nr:hypothetical protein [Neobacillus jeddahensis]
MNAYVIALLSMIILAPIIFFLRLGFTTKGKMLFLGLSFVFALLGILSRSIFALWQTILLLFLFVTLTTLWGMKKLAPAIFIQKDEDHSTLMETNLNPETPLREINHIHEDLPVKLDLEKVENQEIFQEEQNEHLFEDISVLMESVQLEKQEVNDEQSLLEQLNEIEPFTDEGTIIDDDEEFFKFSKEDVNVSSTELGLTKLEQTNTLENNLQDDQQVLESSYLAELEQLMFEGGLTDLDDGNVHIDLGKTDVETEDMDDLIVVEEIEVEDVDEVAEITGVDDVVEVAEITDVKDVDGVAEITGVDDVVEVTEITDVEDVDEVAEITGVDDVVEVTEITGVEDSVEVMEEVEEKIETRVQDQKTLENDELHKQLFGTFISQLQLSRKLMNSEQYEQLLVDYLHPNLPVSEYYTIAMILVRHYLSEKQYTQLSPVLSQLEEKVSNHPVLLQEIQFLNTLYAEK